MRRVLVGFGTLAIALVLAAQADAGSAIARSSGLRWSRALAAQRPVTARGARATWTAAGAMTQAMEENGGAVFMGGRVVVPGGYSSVSPLTPYGKVQLYNPTANTWSVDNAHPFPTNLSATGLPISTDGAVCTDGTKLYFVGGSDGQFIYNTLQIYSPSTGWTAGAFVNNGTMAYVSQDAGCSVIGGKLFLYGGYGALCTTTCGANDFQKLTLIYNPATNRWADTGKQMLVGTIWMSYGTVAGKAAIAGGGTANLTTNASSKIAEIFMPASGWRRLVDLPAASGASVRGLIGFGMGALGNKLAVWGGVGGSSVSGFFLNGATFACPLSSCISPTGSGSWVNLNQNMITPRAFFGWTVAVGKAFAAGGDKLDGTGPIATAEHSP